MADETETYPGAHVSILIDGARCIHSRNCVLGAPAVFVPNAVGPWVHPDNADAGTVAAIAESCPSGAIRYRRNDGAAQESAPPVNTIRIRENGPLAFHAELAVGEERSFFRATLCRCGASERKPYCDSSHHKVNFQATGEPPAVDSPPPGARDGLLTVTPTPNGPLMVSGSAEIVSGTGRKLTTTQKTFLCRCGASDNKPFCDGSHKRVGFTG